MSAIKREVLNRYVIMLKMHHHQFVTRPLSIYSAANCCWRKILDTIKKRFHHFSTFFLLSFALIRLVSRAFYGLLRTSSNCSLGRMKNAHRYISKGKTEYHQGRWENIKSACRCRWRFVARENVSLSVGKWICESALCSILAFHTFRWRGRKNVLG